MLPALLTLKVGHSVCCGDCQVITACLGCGTWLFTHVPPDPIWCFTSQAGNSNPCLTPLPILAATVFLLVCMSPDCHLCQANTFHIISSSPHPPASWGMDITVNITGCCPFPHLVNEYELVFLSFFFIESYCCIKCNGLAI